MATIVDTTTCEAAGQGQEAGLLPISPFAALQFHYGMLLGVDDLDTGQAYPRGKFRLHNAWPHREGVVWGLDVAINLRNELTSIPASPWIPPGMNSIWTGKPASTWASSTPRTWTTRTSPSKKWPLGSESSSRSMWSPSSRPA